MGVSGYCATKFAQEGFGESLFQEALSYGIYVSLVAPAIIPPRFAMKPAAPLTRGHARGITNRNAQGDRAPVLIH